MARPYPVAASDFEETRKRTEDHFRFLAEASVALGEITDVDSTLGRIAKLAVPYFCDWCEVTVREPGGKARSVTVQHGDPGMVKHAKAMLRALGLPVGECRLPMGPRPAGLKERARQVLANLGQAAPEAPG